MKALPPLKKPSLSLSNSASLSLESPKSSPNRTPISRKPVQASGLANAENKTDQSPAKTSANAGPTRSQLQESKGLSLRLGGEYSQCLF